MTRLPFPRALALLAALLLPHASHAQAPSDGGSLAASASPEVASLDADLRAILRATGWSDARYGVVVVSLDRGDTLFALNADESLAPASNLKLYSTAAALSYLGPDFRYSTYLIAGGDVRDGVLEGDVVLFGTGDPSVSARMQERASAVMDALADSLAMRGVREVRGAVVGDGSFFDAQWRGEGWTASDLGAAYGAPVGALSADENLTARRTPVENPVRTAASVLRDALERRGIAVRGGVRINLDPSSSPASAYGPAGVAARRGTIVATHLSPPLRDIASVTNHVSHNLFADAQLKTAGRAAGGKGSFDAGFRAVRKLLAQAGADTAAVRMHDGSGLSRLDRVTARTTVQLLSFMSRGPLADVYLASLPGAAEKGGLKRMYGTAAAGNLRAKTGTIHGVSSLSGYVTSAGGERLAFSIIGNDLPDTHRAKRVEDEIGVRLAEFRRP
ncbi:MAG TPA: D-alanyl-D-alanine carboxypeptidase/D-alanyl-D-alanine-endopeptidase [Longimicrobiaceae bacterium]|nr:D-alanyl-D-alanine carboxypeptidase/D-alanyl-D-alanine-endopeptidase [Longimicrobiaceae bacterium]